MMYDDYKTPDTSRVGETSFMEAPRVTEATSTFRLRQEIKLKKLTELYKHLAVKGGPTHADSNQFWVKKNPKQAILTFFS